MKRLNDTQKRLGFNIHAIVFALTMALLAAINLTVGPPYWVLWVLPWWSVGIAMHWLFGRGHAASGDGTR